MKEQGHLTVLPKVNAFICKTHVAVCKTHIMMIEVPWPTKLIQGSVIASRCRPIHNFVVERLRLSLAEWEQLARWISWGYPETPSVMGQL